MRLASISGRVTRRIIDANRTVSSWQARAAGKYLGRTNGWRNFRGHIIPGLLIRWATRPRRRGR